MKTLGLICCILFAYNFGQLYSAVPCEPKDFGKGSVVCVCNLTYCDTIDPIGEIEIGHFLHVVSTKTGKRFEASSLEMNKGDSEAGEVIINIDRDVKMQHIIGFGGAFTDAAGFHLSKLDQGFQRTLLAHYFGKEGLEYNIGRIPIAGCDFSTRPYSYADVENDTELAHFALAEEDYRFKIPYIQYVKGIKKDLKLFASPWSGPAWMKTNKAFNATNMPAVLIPEYYNVWARYFIKFLDAYKANNLDMWAITTQNEPAACYVPGFSWNCMGFNADTMKVFIRDNLGPALVNSTHKNTKVITLDDQRPAILHWAHTILGDPDSAKYVHGIGIHWYFNWLIGPQVMDQFHEEFPDYFQLATEACTGSDFFELPVVMGSWERGEEYSHDVIENLNHWVGGWVDWNLFLGMDGGPNWAENQVDAPIIIDGDLENQVIYKQPMFYHFGHVTKFLPEDSYRISTSSLDFKGLEITSGLRPDGQVAVVILNRQDIELSVTIIDSLGGKMNIHVEPRSIQSLVYNLPSNETPITEDPNAGNHVVFSVKVYFICIITILSFYTI